MIIYKIKKWLKYWILRHFIRNSILYIKIYFLPVFFIQNFYCYRKTAALLHASRAQKGGCLTIPDLLPVPRRKIHHIPVRCPVRPRREILSRNPYDPLKCLRKEKISCHMRRDHEVSEVPERTVRRKRFRLRHIESAAAEMSLF